MKAFLKSFLSSALGSMFGLIFGAVLLLVIIPGIFMLVIGAGRHKEFEVIKNHSILDLDLRGQIVEKHRPMEFELFGEGSIFGEDRTLGLYELNKAIDLAKTDPRISGIYLELHGFEAGWAAVTALHQHLEDFKKSGKWIYAYADQVDEMAYYVATAATQISMEPYGDVEFNGLTMQEAFLKGLLDKVEVKPMIFRVGRFKAAVEPLIREQMSPENREQTQTLINDIWAVVREAAAKTAKVDPKKIDEMAANLTVVSAATAKKAGLIHETQFADEVEDKLRELTVGKDNDLELVTPGRFLKSAMQRKHTGKKIALIFAEGEIKSGDGGNDSIGSTSLREDILDAKADDDVAAIVLRVNSPGGDALASDVLWRELRQSDDELPIVVSMGDMAASGGYYIATAGRYIFAEPTTITGSIGVFGMMFDAEKAFKNKAGVSFDRVVTHPHADIGSYTHGMTAFEQQSVQSEVERVYHRFLDVVQEGRGYEKRADVESIAEGRVWSGTRAKELGLVDEIGGLDQAIAKAAEYAEIKDYRIEIFPADIDPLRRLVEKVTGESMARVVAGVMAPGLGTAAGWLHEAGLWTPLKPAASSIPMKSGIYARLPFEMKIH